MLAKKKRTFVNLWYTANHADILYIKSQVFVSCVYIIFLAKKGLYWTDGTLYLKDAVLLRLLH